MFNIPLDEIQRTVMGEMKKLDWIDLPAIRGLLSLPEDLTGSKKDQVNNVIREALKPLEEKGDLIPLGTPPESWGKKQS